MDLQLRDARPEDAAAFAALLGDLGYPAGAEQAAVRLERLTADPTSRVFVAEVDGRLAGFAGLHFMHLVEHDEPGCVMTAIAVGNRHRRLGVGARLAAAVEDEARAHGCSRVVLSTAHHRADAHGFYEALGYEHTGRRYLKVL